MRSVYGLEDALRPKTIVIARLPGVYPCFERTRPFKGARMDPSRRSSSAWAAALDEVGLAADDVV